MSDNKAGAPDESELQPPYAKQIKIHPRQAQGVFARLRVASVFALLGLYYVVPFLRWDGRQAILFDLPARKFYLFGITLWPQDFVYLAALLIVAGLTLFFVTALAGRVWCGYACPQTVWTEAFLWIERKVEGNRSRQIKLDKAPWSGRKIRIKVTKHSLWIVFSLWTGFTFVGYFTPLDVLFSHLQALNLGTWELFWILFYGFATYGNAGWMREQVCKYMCPYARFQGAMFDKDTLIIAYDSDRGEPRGGRRKSEDYQVRGLGDCIDCTLCVQVCPTGIDIRDGMQYECIACSACIDACDGVMAKMGYAPSLVGYTTAHSAEGKQTRILRPRVIVYAVILSAIIGGLGYSIATRSELALDVIRDRNRLFIETDEGLIENVYLLKILNMDETPHRFLLTATGINGLQLSMDKKRIEVDAGSVVSMPIRVRVDEAELPKQSNVLYFQLQSLDEPSLQTTEAARFLGPRVKK